MVGKNNHTILISTDTIGGVWSYTISLIRAMQQYPVKFIIAAMGPAPNKNQREQVSELNNAILESFDGKLEWMDNPWDDLNEEEEWLMSLSATYQPDLVHLNHYAHATLDYNAPKVLVMHSCVRSWWRAVKKVAAPDHWSRYSVLVQKAIDSCDEVIAPSNAILNAYRKEYTGLDKARVIYNGITTGDYSGNKKEPFVFSMGRLWDEAKNIDLLIKAAPYIDFPIYIAGDNNIRYNKNLPDNIFLLGRQSHEAVRGWLYRASVYVLPVKYEPFGLSFLEAAASGCALIGGKIDTLQEIWDGAALLCDTENVQELATLTNVLMKDEILLREMQTRCRKRAQEFSVIRTSEGYFNLYKTLNTTFANYEH